MKKMICILLLVLLLLSACGKQETPPEDFGPEAPEETPVPGRPGASSLYVKAIPELPEDFIIGMDASSVLAEEASGVRYYNFDGEEQDLFRILADQGFTHIRVRVWNDPHDAQGHGYGGGSNDIDAAVEIGKRVTENGMKLIVDFHYSDFWADPGKQMAPKAWADMDIDTKANAAYEFTRDSLQKLSDAGVDVGMVQLGNETNGALCGETEWFRILYIMKSGSQACREVFPDALIAVHFTNPENSGAFPDYADKLQYFGLDYDVFATSYYPYWHGSLENLTAVLSNIAQTRGKKVMVMETAYAYTGEDTDFFGNSISPDSSVDKPYPYSVQGQTNAVRDVVDAVAQATNGIGVCYWAGAWISVGQNSREENSALWEKYGSGWASSYAAEYDPDDAGQWYGGSSWDNQAFFDANGHPLESLKLFGMLRGGNERALTVDEVEECEMKISDGGKVELPKILYAVMSDNSRQVVSVTWDVDEAQLEQMSAGGAGTYEIRGEAGGSPARCRVIVQGRNLLANPGFESGAAEPWVVTDLARADELFVENKPNDSLAGNWHLHFWSYARDSVEFTAEQAVDGLEAGSYRFSISIMGGDGGETDIYAYVKVDGTIVATAPMHITGYNNWDTGAVEPVAINAGQSLSVGVYVKCEGSGNGAWGKIDEAVLSAVN